MTSPDNLPWPDRDLQVLLKVPVTPVSEFAIAPTRSTSDDVGIELYSAFMYCVKPFQTTQIRTDVQICLPNGVTGKVMPKAGNPITLTISPTVIPSQYKEPVEVTVTNASDQPFVISRGFKVARLRLQTLYQPVLDLQPLSPTSAYSSISQPPPYGHQHAIIKTEEAATFPLSHPGPSTPHQPPQQGVIPTPVYEQL